MTAKTTTADRPWSVRLISAIGWILLCCGAAALLYLAYALLFTNVAAERAQGDLRAQWDNQVEGSPAGPGPTELAAEVPSAAPSTPSEDGEAAATPTAPAQGVALLEFARPGSASPLVHDEPLVVLDGVAIDDLQRGPGRYPGTALPGRPGNFAVAGHRTTYGAPFFHLDALRRGDRVLVTDRRGRRHTYEVARQQVVQPADVWVIGQDPLGTGRPTLTLTTCNPRFSAAERLVVHAELVS